MNSSIPLEKVNSETVHEERKRYVVHTKSGSSNVLPTYRVDDFNRKNTPERQDSQPKSNKIITNLVPPANFQLHISPSPLLLNSPTPMSPQRMQNTKSPMPTTQKKVHKKSILHNPIF